MSKIIPFSQLARAQDLNLLEHKRQEYQQRENYLQGLRRLLFQIEGQMRMAEFQQVDVFLQVAHHFQVDIAAPPQGDRMAWQRLFSEHPLLIILTEFFSGRIGADECCDRIAALKSEPPGDKEGD
uniref:Uncharacterized protein n=1 Tax=Desulfobacca acetoxidans TaxID=60893 RepID=A0A7V4LDT5_9BACT